jgi:hypothetical protein
MPKNDSRLEQRRTTIAPLRIARSSREPKGDLGWADRIKFEDQGGANTPADGGRIAVCVA